MKLSKSNIMPRQIYWFRSDRGCWSNYLP